MPSLRLPPIEDLEVEHLALLPRGYRYELRQGNLVVGLPTNFWQKSMTGRLLMMLYGTGADVFHEPGVLGSRPRDSRLPDLGVLIRRPRKPANCTHLPGSAFRLVIEIVSRDGQDGECTDKMAWYAEQGIPEYWIVTETPDRADADATVHVHRFAADTEPVYARERSLLLSELEAGYAAR
jgi:Uma2 family endonuclease